MWIYYHFYYDILYFCILAPGGVYKILVGGIDVFIIVSTILTLFYCLMETFRLNFAYKGNINESSPELMAFIGLTFLGLILTVVPIFVPKV